MSKYRICDVMVELAELGTELLQEIRQELQYHRASVYKNETSKRINDRVDRLKVLAKVLGDDLLDESLADFDAMAASAGLYAAPGECTLTTRCSHLLGDAEQILREFQRRATQRRGVISDDLLKTIQTHRRALIAVCRQGSRSWDLLKNI